MKAPFRLHDDLMTSYSEALQWLFQRSKGLGAKYDLVRMEKASALLGFPERSFRTAHVGGTNGKGSVTTKIARALQSAGYKVGLYTSPHIRSCTERIQVSGKAILPEKFLSLLQTICSKVSVEELGLTFFEIMTLIAFLAFQQEQVDVAVIEVGLGGRLDATNIIQPCLSIITSIGLDHTDLLGDTIEKITLEKAGIIKPSTPIVIGPQVNIKIISSIAAMRDAPLHHVEKVFESFDDENSEIAYESLLILRALFPRLDERSITYGISQRPPCRCEKVPSDLVSEALNRGQGIASPLVYMDVAHNPDGIKRLLKTLEKENGESSRYLFIVGASKEKDLDEMLHLLLPKSQLLIATQAQNSQRAFLPEQIVERARDAGFSQELVVSCASVRESIDVGLSNAFDSKCPLVITGSFFIMGEARKAFGYQEFEDPIVVNEASIKPRHKA